MRVTILAVMIAGMAMATHAQSRGTQVTSKEKLPVGIVEGFYGKPWSHEDRLSIIRFMGERGLNHYCYAPKDDPYHREKWREPYPPEQFVKILQLVGACRKARVTFCFAVSPGLDIRYSDSHDFELLAGKLKPLADAGVSDFALFLDDVPAEFKHPEDKAKYGSFGAAHADLGNRLLAELRKWNAANSLILCPTEYYHADPSPYIRSLCGALNKEIPVVWTGMGVTSQFISPANLLRIRAATGVKPFLWDNYPVNDYDQGHLFLGPLCGRTSLMPLQLSGYWANPMNEAEASKIPLWTIADYLKDPDNYNPDQSWRAGIRAVAGDRAYPYMMTLCDMLSGSFLVDDECRVLSALAADFLNDPNPSTALSLQKYLQKLLDLDANLKKALRNRKFYDELRPSLKKLKKHALNLQLALAVAEADPASTQAGELRQKLVAGLEAVDMTDTSPAARNPARATAEEWVALLADDDRLTSTNVGDQVFAMIQQEFHRRDLRRSGKLVADATCSAPPFRGNTPEFAVDGNPKSFFWASRPWRNGDNFTVDFMTTRPAGTVVRVAQADAGHPRDFVQNGTLQASIDGTKWVDLAKAEAPEFSAVAPVDFRYARIVGLADQTEWLIIREFSATPR